ncbi:hypothetical protein LSTR_LSTR014151, partial [Laodelphax striatellus]
SNRSPPHHHTQSTTTGPCTHRPTTVVAVAADRAHPDAVAATARATATGAECRSAAPRHAANAAPATGERRRSDGGRYSPAAPGGGTRVEQYQFHAAAARVRASYTASWHRASRLFSAPSGFSSRSASTYDTEVMPDDLLPSLPYYDLPAGLMVPLIKLEDCEYKPLDPDAIRLPPPAPPSERLLAAFKQFYAPPGHSHPLDRMNYLLSSLSISIVILDGWEKLGLYEYYRAKNTAKKKKDDDIAAGRRMRSRSPSPIMRSKSKSKTPPPKRRYRSRSRSRSKGRSPGRRNSGGSSSANNNSSSNSQNQNSGSARRRQNSGRRSGGAERSRSRSRSPLSPLHNNSNTPQKQLIDRDRSPTPPSFAGGAYGKISLERLDESNKGHQMLRKMGWGGAGLGAKEQGIEQPISGGEIRDRTDQYKGVGLNLNDPYENFRKSKGQAFITRMKARAEERVQDRDTATSSPERE